MLFIYLTSVLLLLLEINKEKKYFNEKIFLLVFKQKLPDLVRNELLN